MKEHTLERSQLLPLSLDAVFAFFADAGNLESLTPPWLRFRILTPRPIEMKPGTLIDYRIRWGIIPIRWTTRIIDWNPPHGFSDEQIKGPYKLWHHTHRFESVPGGTRMTDVVRYALPLGFIGRWMNRLKVAGDLERIFDYRRDQVGRLLGSSLTS
jgi:ligand-binding SRPBCC domain-containing protein